MLVRRATEADCRFIYDISMDRTTRMNSTRSTTYTYEEHERWYAQKLADPFTAMYIGEVGTPIGQIRFGRVGRSAEIAIAVAPMWRGHGRGNELLWKAEPYAQRDLQVERFIAMVLIHNIASLRLFGNAGYAPVSQEHRMGKLHYRFEKEAA